MRYHDKPGQPFDEEPNDEHPFKVYMTFASEAAASNGLTFASVGDGEKYGLDLLLRWTYPTGFLVKNELTGQVVLTWA